MIYLNLCKTVNRKIIPNRSGIFRQLMRYPKQHLSTVLKPNCVHPRPLFDLRQLKSVASTRLPLTRHFTTHNAQTGTKDLGMVQFQFLWRLMGLGDMTPPPLNPKKSQWSH